ncbi:O-antigen ligase family protein [Candidatus Pelagibacter sp. Uisw_121]|uniref:O-antigen ligase family protein n=1 Tax=Candidatus Pelagibacter sp. Uisw_121 TaxID=3230987 RepID=UPI0039E8884F
MNSKILNYYFLFLFSFIPASIIIGPAISLVNILLIDISFIFLIFYKKDFKFLSNKTIKLIILLCLYLVFNSIVAKDFSISANRNLGFIRFGILFLAFNYFFYNKSFINRVLIVWITTLFILSLDTYIESFFGQNILGYGEKHGRRIVSFFKDEPIVGGYINGFYLIIIGYLFYINKNTSNKYKYIILIFSIFFITAIILTGERSNAIKAVSGFFLFYFFNDFFKFKEKIFSILLLILIFVFLFNTSNFLKLRYGGQFFKPIISVFQVNNELNKQNKLKDSLYIRLYQSGFEVFKKYPVFGVGNKNYRVETCSTEKNSKYFCSTHPHQIYFEFLSEHGLVGSMILLFILFNLIVSKIRIIINSNNSLQLGCLIFLITSFIPLLPSGAFFADYNLTIFWVNLSIMYSIGEKTNVYTSS